MTRREVLAFQDCRLMTLFRPASFEVVMVSI
jgi:hypothetical protein